MNRRTMLLLVVAVPLLGAMVALGWAMARTGGKSGAFGINTKFGEVPVGRRLAPDFELDRLDGGTIRLSNLRGKIVMVDFWASWCPPCRQEAPALAQVYREYAGRGVEFVGVTIWDSPEAARDFVQRYGITYPTGLADKGTLPVEYGVAGIPEKFFIDRDGVIVKKVIGPAKEEQLRQLLDTMLVQ